MLDRAFAADPHVIGRPLQHLLDHAYPPAGLGDDGQPDHLAVVKPPRLQLTHAVFRDFEVAPAKKLCQGAVVDAAELDHETRLPLPAPLDLVLATVEHQRSEERRVGKECRSRWSPDHEKEKKESRLKRVYKSTKYD